MLDGGNMLASPNCQEEGRVLGAQGVGHSWVPAVVVVNLNALPLKLLDLPLLFRDLLFQIINGGRVRKKWNENEKSDADKTCICKMSMKCFSHGMLQ